MSVSNYKRTERQVCHTAQRNTQRQTQNMKKFLEIHYLARFINELIQVITDFI